ncbi:pseudaminic acid cytidylyltransferase [Candidatus Babeliales bacterium]|nr:pseudaminic acid cytidylyltransferase [Candidatus Babeliales bacterium]
MNKKKCLAIIPARGGSKRIPRKNIKPFFGKPIIKYSIDAALESNCFDEVMVSTEDKEIASLASSLGAKIPFFRSLRTADGNIMFVDVVKEVLEDYEKLGSSFDYFCCILATAPFVTPELLQKGFKKLLDSKASSLIPIIAANHPMHQSLELKDGRAVPLWPDCLQERSQDLLKVYFNSGLFLWVSIPAFKKQELLITDNCATIIVPELEAQDIDTEEDWILAELKYKRLKFSS